jgi:hypothetical protein
MKQKEIQPFTGRHVLFLGWSQLGDQFDRQTDRR